MRDLSKLKHFIVIIFERDRRAGTLKMHPGTYNMAVVDESNVFDAIPACTPAATCTQLTLPEGASPQFPYASIVDHPIHAALCSRPGIAFAAKDVVCLSYTSRLECKLCTHHAIGDCMHSLVV